MKRRAESDAAGSRLAHLTADNVRSFFPLTRGQTSAQNTRTCIFCQDSFSAAGDTGSGSTSGLRRHLEGKHLDAALARFPPPPEKEKKQVFRC